MNGRDRAVVLIPKIGNKSEKEESGPSGGVEEVEHLLMSHIVGHEVAKEHVTVILIFLPGWEILSGHQIGFKVVGIKRKRQNV